MDQYYKVTIRVSPELHDILIAELEGLNYDSFQELDNELEAYILEQQYNEGLLKTLLSKYRLDGEFISEILAPMNWNEQWEKNFHPVYINRDVQIRASFHEKKAEFIHDLVINPKMSFGTGHHETTHLIVEEQLKIDHQDKDVLDLGTGTGILAIMASKLGARTITATDIDDWSIENCKENFELNDVVKYRILQGSVDKLTLEGTFPVIFANINKNVLLAELPYYSKLLSKGGILVLSGFYEADIPDLEKVYKRLGLKIERQNSMNHWSVLVLTKA